jgi:tetratricopeptide (TPR) repeat protein
MWWIFPLVLLLLSLGCIFFIAWRKFAQVRSIDFSNLTTEKTKQMKEALFLQRFERIFIEKIFKQLPIKSSIKIVGSLISKKGRRLVQYLYRLEQSYQRQQEEQMGQEIKRDVEWIRKLFAEAEDFQKQEEYFQAEKRYIEVISRHPKYAKAYEGLGNLYLAEKKYDQARESFEFALKLEPKDASVLVSLGEICLQQAKAHEAFIYLKQAIEVRPHNPKYLDYFIESAIQAQEKIGALEGINKLRHVNPENQKLSSFEQRTERL